MQETEVRTVERRKSVPRFWSADPSASGERVREFVDGLLLDGVQTTVQKLQKNPK
jgi:hypothetical protein